MKLSSNLVKRILIARYSATNIVTGVTFSGTIVRNADDLFKPHHLILFNPKIYLMSSID